ncbi:MAG: acetyltransferase [bacterium]|jgi:sugar O-acyltransferase (sialic acid O-acetyltransferase NeuD family)
MEDIYIIGSGGFAKEVYFLIKETNLYEFKGFVDYKPKNTTLTIGVESFPIIDEDEFLNGYESSNIVIGVGRPHLLKMLSEKFKNFNKPNIIHPSFISDSKNIIMGVGNIITAGVIFTTNITIGSFNVFNLNMTIGHDSMIGNHNVFNPSTNISGNNKIGNGNLFGVGSISLENMEIGNNNVIGASALLTKNINNDGVYVGIPAKIMKNNN